MFFAGAAARMFIGLGTEYSAAYNAAWLCPLIALMLFIPLALSVRHAGSFGNSSPFDNLAENCPAWLSFAAAAVFTGLLLYDCAIVLRLTVASANFLALNNISLPWLVLPMALSMFFVDLLPPDSEGNSVRIWLLILPLMLAVVAAVQFKRYNSRWLQPVLGGGIPAIAQGSLYCGGWLSLLFLPWLTAVPDRKKNRPLRPGMLSALAAAVLIASLRMLCPSLVETNLSEMARIEIILSNNRVSHVLQMLLTLLWFGNILHLAAIESVTAASFVRSRLPKLPNWLTAAICAAVPSIISLTDLTRSMLTGRFYSILYILIGGLTALLMSVSIAKTGGKPHAHP